MPVFSRCRLLTVLVVAVGVLGAVAACTTDDGDRSSATIPVTVAPLARAESDATVVPTMPMPLGFVPADTRGAILPVAKSNPGADPPLPVRGGQAQLSGTVYGPDGPLEGATVRIERFIGFRSGRVDITTGRGGRYVIGDLLGGKYRVRAWVRPSVATVEPQTVYVTAQGNATLDITADRHDATTLQGALAVADPRLGQQVLFQALLTKEEVDADGIVVGRGLEAAELVVQPGPGIDVLSANPVRTAADGSAGWNVQCSELGAHQLTVVGGDQSILVTLPECQMPDPGAPPPVSVPSPTTELAPPPPVPDWPVGARFRLPFVGPVPAGVYSSRDSGCRVRLDLYGNGAWNPVTFQGQAVNLPGPARFFTAMPGSPACTFERIR